MRYLSQRYSMKDNTAKALLTDIGTEELAHLEMVAALIHQLTKNATTTEIENSPMAAYYIDHAKSVYPSAAAGNPWKAEYIGVKGDPIADLVEDLAADGAIV
jgi:spore coat protein JC